MDGRLARLDPSEQIALADPPAEPGPLDGGEVDSVAIGDPLDDGRVKPGAVGLLVPIGRARSGGSSARGARGSACSSGWASPGFAAGVDLGERGAHRNGLVDLDQDPLEPA